MCGEDVTTKSDQVIDELSVDPPNIISDHSLISWCISLDRLPPITINRQVRDWNKIDIESFRVALIQSKLCDVTNRPTFNNLLGRNTRTRMGSVQLKAQQLT